MFTEQAQLRIATIIATGHWLLLTASRSATVLHAANIAERDCAVMDSTAAIKDSMSKPSRAAMN